MKKVKTSFFILFLSLPVFLFLKFGINQDEPKPITLTEYNKIVSRKDKFVLVYFHASWCMVCHKMQPTIDKIKIDYKVKLDVLEIDTERDKEVSEHFEVNSLPKLLFYRNGIIHWTYIGLIPERELRKKLDSTIPVK